MNPLDDVLESLYRSREKVIADPEWFEPDSLERIESAIRYVQEITGTEEAA